MRIRLAIPDRLVTAPALEAALEAVALADAEAIRRGEIPHAAEGISGGVRWQPERFSDGEHFDMAHQVMRRRWGDCDDLAPWLTGSLLAHEEDPGARTRVIKTGPDRWHAVTETSDGKILDPSRWAGMGKRSAPTSTGVSGLVARPFARPMGGAIAVVPDSGRWRARCDLPWPDGSAHLASHAWGDTPDAALERAVSGAVTCGEEIDSPLCDRMRCAGEMLLCGADELVGAEGEVGSIFGKIFKVLKGPVGFVLNPALALATHTATDKRFAGLRSAAANILPGGGALANIAPSALSLLSHGGGSAAAPGAITDPRSGAVSVPLEPHDEQQPHGQHMFLYFHPSDKGPVVMRL